MADTTPESILREIDEELRQERYLKLWKLYGNYVIGAALALVIGVAGYQGWRSYDLKTRLAQGEQFAAAIKLAKADQRDAAARAFATLASEAKSGYALLARFQEAALLARRGDRNGAAAAYREVATDDGVDPIYRDLAEVLQTLLEMDNVDASKLIERLAPLTADGNPWRHSARELTAVLAGRGGDREKARTLFAGLANDPSAPQGIRARASEMLAILGG